MGFYPLFEKFGCLIITCGDLTQGHNAKTMSLFVEMLKMEDSVNDRS